MASFEEKCVSGIVPNQERMEEGFRRSLMLVTALNTHIGYENAAKTAKLAWREDLSIKEACIKLKFLTEEEFDNIFRPEDMV